MSEDAADPAPGKRVHSYPKQLAHRGSLPTRQERWDTQRVVVEVLRDLPTLARRADEIAVITGLTAAGARGEAGTLVLRGEAGVGKTSLLREGCARTSTTAEVVWVSCLPLSSLTVPFGPLVSALRRRGAQAQAPLRALLHSDGQAPLAFDAWLDEVCAARPVVLVVDDIHWADQSTLDVLLYVLAGPEERRLCVFLSVRDGEEGPLLPGWLANVRRLPHTSELRVGRLDRLGVDDQLNALFGRPPRQSLVDQVYARAGGNPYLTELLVRGLTADSSSVRGDLPTELREAVSRTWQSLTPNAQALTRLLALTGHPQTGEDLARLAGPAGVAGDVVPLLREAVDAGVVGPDTDQRYWFVHPLLPEVLEQSLLPEERKALHAALAHALEPGTGSTADAGVQVAVALADHHAGAGHDEEAFRWALIAADAAERSGGYAEALRLLLRARSLLPGVISAPLSEVALLRRVQSAAQGCGALGPEIEAILGLLDLVDPGADPLLVSELLMRMIDLEYETCREPMADAPQSAVRLSSVQPTSAAHATALAYLARDELWRDVRPDSTRASEVVRLARSSASPKALAHALISRAIARVFAGEDGALEDALEAETAAAEAGDFLAYVRAVACATNCIGITDPRVVEHSVQSRLRLEALAAPHRFSAMLCALEAFTLLMRGDWRACAALLRVAMGSTPGPRADVIARLTAALLDVRQGRYAQAEDHLTRAAEISGAPRAFFGYHAIRAELAVAKGDNRAALEAALEGLSVGHAELVEHLLPLAGRALANEAQILRDRGAAPEPVLAAVRELKTQHPEVPAAVGPGPAHAAQIRAMQAVYDAEVARATNDDHMSGAWRGTADQCAEAGLAWEEAYSRWRAAEAGLQSTATREMARADLRRAHEIATELAATPLLNEIEVLARGARVRLAADHPPGWPTATYLPQLTERERQVLRLVVAGRAYSEIARELVISEKTVSSHISNMLRKTDTTSRLELAQLARRVSSATFVGVPSAGTLSASERDAPVDTS